MAETPDTVFKSGCCPKATGISLPAREYRPDDGIHHFDFRSTMRQVRRGPRRLPSDAEDGISRQESQTRGAPCHSTRAAMCAPRAGADMAQRRPRSVDDPGCVKTRESGGRTELFSQFPSADGWCNWFSHRRNREGSSTRKSSVRVFTQLGPVSEVGVPQTYFVGWLPGRLPDVECGRLHWPC